MSYFPLTTYAQAKQVEVDFGTTPVERGVFVVTDADVTASSKLTGNIAYVAPTGKALDELQFDAFDLRFAPGAGGFTLQILSLQGTASGKLKVNYTVSAA
jgi:hypothetical protein